MDACDPPSTISRQSAGQCLAVEVIRRARGWGEHVDDASLVSAIEAAYCAGADEREPAEVSVLLSDDTGIRKLNATWRNKDEATNVLSFPLDSEARNEGRRHLGDIVLAVETVSREAEEKRIPVRQHAVHLAVHGLLHLLGHDHEHLQDAEAMEALEVEILAGLGLPNPYQEYAAEDGDVR